MAFYIAPDPQVIGGVDIGVEEGVSMGDRTRSTGVGSTDVNMSEVYALFEQGDRKGVNGNRFTDGAIACLSLNQLPRFDHFLAAGFEGFFSALTFSKA